MYAYSSSINQVEREIDQWSPMRYHPPVDSSTCYNLPPISHSVHMYPQVRTDKSSTFIAIQKSMFRFLKV